ncbi:MAG: hypothetical protein LBB79_01690 [Prevotellaceae bacterium]|jgi:hypothetical protein|nr:hypothetical protein [Prevotellaceae bacterium]
MKKLCLSIAALLSSNFLLTALDDNSLHFRAAGVDIATQKFYLRWSLPNAGDTADVKGFWILQLREDAQANIIMDTLAEADNRATRFVDNATSCCAPSIYTISLIPKNTSGGSATYKPPFRTMRLDSPTLDECANTISLRWSDYQQLDRYSQPPTPLPGFTGEVRYHIYGYIGGSTFKPDSAAWLGTSGSATSFALPVAEEKQRYHLYVAAVYNDGKDTSYSNRESIFVPLPVRPRYIYLDSVLSENQSATLRFRVDPSTEYTRFWAEKSSDINGAYSVFEEFADKRQASVTDNAQGGSYSFYRISAVNGCGSVTISSPAVTNLVPVVSGETAPSVKWGIAVWHDGSSGVTRRAQRYDVYRTSPHRAAGFVDSTENASLDDNLSHLPDSVICSSPLCYRVEAFIRDSMQRPLAFVRSAEACAAVATGVSMPNAVQPGSEVVNAFTGKSRSKFEPLCSCMKGFALSVYTPNGKLIYAGAEPWSGRENNSENFVSEGVYIYHIKITFVTGEQVEKAGTVAVVY